MFSPLAKPLRRQQDELMEMVVLSAPFEWDPQRQPPLQDLGCDWYGEVIEPAARIGLVEDPDHLWLIAARNAPAQPHPSAGLGDFQAGLWQHDVAELFVATADRSSYLEFNLSPRGAWWMERFCAPRKADPLPVLPEVKARANTLGSGGWQAALGIPLPWLRTTIGWGPDSPLNVTLILDSPAQRFITACDLGGGTPDFHQPMHFRRTLRRSATG